MSWPGVEPDPQRFDLGDTVYTLALHENRVDVFSFSFLFLFIIGKWGTVRNSEVGCAEEEEEERRGGGEDEEE